MTNFTAILEAVALLSLERLLILHRYVCRQIARRCEKDCGVCCRTAECPGKRIKNEHG